jgi:hypothetical protein
MEGFESRGCSSVNSWFNIEQAPSALSGLRSPMASSTSHQMPPYFSGWACLLHNLAGEFVLVLIRRYVLVLIRRYVFSYATSCPWVRAWHFLDSCRHDVAPNTATHHRSDLGILLNILALDRIRSYSESDSILMGTAAVVPGRAKWSF